MRKSCLILSTLIHGAALGTAVWLGPMHSRARAEPARLSVSPSLPSQPAVVVTPPLDESVGVDEARPVDELSPFDPTPQDADFAPEPAPLADASHPAPFPADAHVLVARPRPVEPTEAEPTAAETDAPPERVPPEPASASSYVEAVAHDERNRPPAYPPAAVRRGQAGEVVLRVHIDACGGVADVEILEPCRFAQLNRAAVRAARTWTFDPARRNGTPVASHLDVPVVFRLR